MRSRHRVVMNYKDDSNDIALNNFSDIWLRFLVKGCQRLESLSLLWCCAVSSHDLVIVANACRDLKVLDLQDCYVRDQGLKIIGIYYKEQKELNLYFCERINDINIVEIIEDCRKSL
uniref:COI1 F-box domain-containing protein n=1 Tax=Physcomitrium patens TaxID=3218 RepID=A0A7I4E2E3_PHYPA